MNNEDRKSFDAVKLMRDIRDWMSKDIRGMTPPEQIEYMEKKSGLRKVKRKKDLTMREPC